MMAGLEPLKDAPTDLYLLVRVSVLAWEVLLSSVPLIG